VYFGVMMGWNGMKDWFDVFFIFYGERMDGYRTVGGMTMMMMMMMTMMMFAAPHRIPYCLGLFGATVAWGCLLLLGAERRGLG